MIDKDRIIGSAKVVKGNVKEAVGKAVGDAKLETQGKADKIEGKVQNVDRRHQRHAERQITSYALCAAESS